MLFLMLLADCRLKLDGCRCVTAACELQTGEAKNSCWQDIIRNIKKSQTKLYLIMALCHISLSTLQFLSAMFLQFTIA